MPYSHTASIRHLTFCLLLAAALVAGGCSSVESTLQQEWSREVALADYSTIDVRPTGGEVFTVQGKAVTVLDGRSGRVRWGEREEKSFFERIKDEAVSVNGYTKSDFQAQKYQYMALREAGIVLLFDYDSDDDLIQAFDLQTGEPLWETTDYRWSLAKFNTFFAREVGNQVGAAVDQLLGGSTSGSIAPLDKKFVRDLSVMLPERNLFLFKTLDGLVSLDLRTGEEQWRIPAFEGAGIKQVLVGPEGDLIVVSKSGESIMDTFAGENHIARIAPERGELVWLAAYSPGPLGELSADGTAARSATVAGGALVLDVRRRIHVYDLRTGEKLWTLKRKHTYTPPLVTDEALYATAYAWAAVQMGIPVTLKRYALRTGEVEWTIDAGKSVYRDMAFVDGRIIAAVTGDLFGGAGGIVALDAATGEEAWRSEPFAEKGLFSSSRQATNLVIDGATVYGAGPSAVHAYDLEDGSLRFKTPREQAGVGAPRYLYGNGETVVAVSSDGVAFYEKSGGSVRSAVATGGVEWDLIAGDHLFLVQDDRLTAVSLISGAAVGEAALFSLDPLYAGNLSDGLFITFDGRHVFTMSKEADRITRYRVGSR